MTYVKLQKIVLISATFLVVCGAMPRVFAQDDLGGNSTDDTTQRCTLAQNYLKNIQKPRDLRARVDRLQAYRYIAQRMDVFVNRLERNNQPGAAGIRLSLTNLNKSIDVFKDDYEVYDKAREDIANLKDCAANSSVFAQKLADARTSRQKVNDDVDMIQAILTPDMKGQLDVLYQQLLVTGKSTGDTAQ